jgi:hypothetical protein
MINRRHRKRAPIKQLRETALKAGDLLSKRGVIHSVNILEALAKDAIAPILPGIPSYLPHHWTIEASRRIMYDFLVDWAEKNKGSEDKQENSSEFFVFVVKRLTALERKYQKEVRKTELSIKKIKKAPLVFEIFSPVRRRQTTRGLHKFFVDSFTVFLINKEGGSTTDYAEWFLGEWTPALDKLWKKNNVSTSNHKSK